MRSGKATGKDGIPAELYKELGEEAFQEFHAILTSIWVEEDMPSQLHDATIVALYKNKGTRADCGIYRGMYLFALHHRQDHRPHYPQ